MNILTFAAIDIGSNGIRILFSNVFEKQSGPSFKKALLVRLPIRLGADTFDRGHISEENGSLLLHGMNAYKHLMKIYRPVNYRACATSALREAGNRKEMVDRIFRETGIDVNIIDGKEEAAILFSTHAESLSGIIKKSEIQVNPGNYLFIDIGGGSTELTLLSGGIGVESKSFKTGTIRKLQNLENLQEKARMKCWINQIASSYHIFSAIGSGGNINKLAKLAGKTGPITIQWIKDTQHRIGSLSYEDRITHLNMNPDRADVILPALEIIISIMEWGGFHTIYAPKFGLADGMIKQLYNEHKMNRGK